MPGSAVVVDVWTVPATPGGVLGTAVLDPVVLDPAELARAAGMPAPAARRFVLGRVLLRHVLAARLGCAPGEVDLRARCAACGGPHGPVTVHPGGPGPGPYVGVTRAGPLVAVAVCATHPVGIDVESTLAVGAAPLADVALSPRERGAPRGRWGRGVARPHAGSLARTWVRKEAALKALGTGLRVEPSSTEVLRPRGRARGVDAVVVGAAGAAVVVGAAGAAVAVADLRLGPGRAGAVAVVAPDLVGGVPRRAGRAAHRLVVRRYDGVSTHSDRRD